MGQDQSTPSETMNRNLQQLTLTKKKSTITNIASKLYIDPIEMNSLYVFLEKNGYVIHDQELGKGGSGIVFSGETANKEPIAIKIVRFQKRGQALGIIQEFNILKSIESNHVVQAIDLLQFESQNSNLLITVMEKCEQNLTSYLRSIRTMLDKYQYHEKIYEICLHLIKGLNDIHQANILHLDIKPNNIMIGRDKQWKFIDMGISVMLQEQNFISHCGLTQLYSSPEQYQSYLHNTNKSDTISLVTKQSDIYSLGLVFLEMTGVIIDKKNIMQSKQSQLQSDGNLEIQLNPQFYQFNNNVILKMIQYNQDRRPSTEYIERQISSLLFDAQYNAQLEKKSSNPSTPLFNQLPKNQQIQGNASPSFYDLSQTPKNSQNNQQNQQTKISYRINDNQISSPQTKYDTSHILKQTNTQSNLQRNSFKCQQYFNQTSQQSFTSISNSQIDHRQSEFYPSNYNNNQSYYSNNSNYRFSTVLAQQY